MPNPIADETVIDLPTLESVLSGLNRSFRWVRTHEGERYWLDVSEHLDAIVVYARTHPEAVQGGVRRTETTSNGAPMADGTFPLEYRVGSDGNIYRWVNRVWELQ